jgi:hypothetical protein
MFRQSRDPEDKFSQMELTVLQKFLNLFIGVQYQTKFKGSIWEKPLRDDEWTILFYLCKELAFLVDYVTDFYRWKVASKDDRENLKFSYRATKTPETQWLRYFVSISTLVKVIIFLWSFRFLLSFMVSMIFG